MSARTIIFGLDALDFTYARGLAGRGLLPWLSGQLQQGSQVSTYGKVISGAEWANAACGVSAAHHGYVHLTQLRLGTYEEPRIDASIIRADPFYVPLTRAGVRTIVVDLPFDRPRPHENLIQVIEWGREFNMGPHGTTPAALEKQVRAWCGAHPLTNYGYTRTDDPTLLALREKLLHGTALKGKLIRELMRHEPRWKCLFAGFSEVHKAGHFFWKYQDPHHHEYAGPDHPLSSALIEVHQALDRECAQICAEAGDDVNTIIASDRGMRANYRGDHLLPRVLERLGLFVGANGAVSAVDPEGNEDNGTDRPHGPRAPSLAHRLKAHVPDALMPWVRRLTGRERANWARTRVFRIADVGTSYLRVNMIGREPQGIVAPGAEYSALLARVERELKALINPATGRSPVAHVVFPQREYSGPFQAELPDIGIVWAQDARVTALESPTIGRVEGSTWEQRSGNHTSEGGLLVSGPRFANGARRAGDQRELAPTVLALHGVSVPAHYELPPMAELCR